MSGNKQVRVSRVADWAGWCSPCESEDRPLVLTRTGPAGSLAWLAGLSDDDRFLLLTCNVCGHWQLVPANEEDDPEVVLTEDPVDASVRDAVLEVVTAARAVPTPRADAVMAAPPVPAVVSEAAAAAVELLVEVPPVHAPACAAVPAPRRPAVALPETSPAFSPEAVAAATRVLAAARAQTQRTAPRSGDQRPAPLDRSRRTRNSATGRRTERPAPARIPRPAAPAVATSIVLPAVTASQLVLATAR